MERWLTPPPFLVLVQGEVDQRSWMPINQGPLMSGSSEPLSRRTFLAAAAIAAAGFALEAKGQDGAATPPDAVLVPNFHPASCGWLTTFSRERVYCANSYLDHLDRVRDDPSYAFVLSEVNNLIAIMNFQPGRIQELKQRIQEKRVELVNGFFLESTTNWPAGKARVGLGAKGLRWYEQAFG